MERNDVQALHRHANRLMIEKFRQESPVSDTPEQRLIRMTIEHPQYRQDYSFLSYSKDWFVSDVGTKTSNLMISSQMVAVDCEMVLCEDGTEGLVRVGAVDRNLKVILDEYVKPHKPVVDYRTTITGVTAEDIKKATLSVVDIQRKLEPFLSTGTILVGHSLSHDLEVMKIDHPLVIDTSLVFKYPNNTRKLRRPSLNTLCMDAAAAMKLALALIEKRVDTTITLSKEMMEAEKSRLFLHRISHNLPYKELERVLSSVFLSNEFNIDIKPAKAQGGYYCAVVIFKSSNEANKAFVNVGGNEEKDSMGLPQKLVSGPRASFYVRKMVQD